MTFTRIVAILISACVVLLFFFTGYHLLFSKDTVMTKQLISGVIVGCMFLAICWALVAIHDVLVEIRSLFDGSSDDDDDDDEDDDDEDKDIVAKIKKHITR